MINTNDEFTNDLAVGLQTTLAEAERVKREYGMCSQQPTVNMIVVKHMQDQGTQLVNQSQIGFVLQARAHELFTFVKQELDRDRLVRFMTTGLVLTGGSSLLSGLVTTAHEVLAIPVRLGAPKTGHILPESLDNPVYATGYGLLLYAFDNRAHTPIDLQKAGSMVRVFSRMKSWVGDFF